MLRGGFFLRKPKVVSDFTCCSIQTDSKNLKSISTEESFTPKNIYQAYT